MVDPKFMIEIEKNSGNRSEILSIFDPEKNGWSNRKMTFRDRSRRDCMVDPEKIHADPAWNYM